MKRLLPCLALLTFLPGCVAWEIRDDVRTTNEHLCLVAPALVHTLQGIDETNKQIAETNTQIALTNAHLVAVEAGLAKVQSQLTGVDEKLALTNPKLNELGGDLDRMRMLQDLHTTLKEVDAALKPLGKSLGTLGGAMSLIGLGGDSSKDLLVDEETPAATPAADAPGSDVAAAKSDAKGGAATAVTEAGAQPANAKRPDPLLGTWVLVFPPPKPPLTSGRILVFSADGKFLFDDEGRPPTPGHWSRKGRSLTMQTDAASGAAGGAGEAGDGGTGGVQETMELLTLNTRTLTVRRGDVIKVYARP